jgi:hypothetical protein
MIIYPTWVKLSFGLRGSSFASLLYGGRSGFSTRSVRGRDHWEPRQERRRGDGNRVSTRSVWGRDHWEPKQGGGVAMAIKSTFWVQIVFSQMSKGIIHRFKIDLIDLILVLVWYRLLSNSGLLVILPIIWVSCRDGLQKTPKDSRISQDFRNFLQEFQTFRGRNVGKLLICFPLFICLFLGSPVQPRAAKNRPIQPERTAVKMAATDFETIWISWKYMSSGGSRPWGFWQGACLKCLWVL